MFLSINWNVDPEIFSFGVLTVRWYGLLWALGIYATLLIVQKLYKHENHPEEWIDKQFMYVVIGTILGARLGHCFFYEWYELPQPITFLGVKFNYFNPYLKEPWNLVKVWEGGLASHGGAIGILVAMYLFSRNVTHKGVFWGLDRLVLGVAITGAMIRLGNLMNSEIYGGTTSLPWGFIFERNGETVPKHPTQIYEMIYCLVTFGVLWWLYWKKEAYKRTGLLLGVFLIGIFFSRFLLEFIKNDQEAFESHLFLNMGQILSLPLIVLGFYLIINNIIKEIKKNREV